MRVDIKPQWRKLAAWYWEKFDQPQGTHLSIWDLLSRDYGARKAFNINSMRDGDPGMWVIFPDEKSYTAFLLRWA